MDILEGQVNSEQNIVPIIEGIEGDLETMESMVADVESQFEDFRMKCEAILNDPASESALVEETKVKLAQAEEERERTVDEMRSVVTSEMIGRLDEIVPEPRQ